MRLTLVLIAIILSSCTPVKEAEYETKYPDTPTMQSAEDAQAGILFKD